MSISRRCKGKTRKNVQCRIMCKNGEFCRHHKAVEAPAKPSTATTTTCSICLNSLTRPATLACGHGFHTLCVRNWSHHGSSCPLCRANFMSSDVQRFRLHLPGAEPETEDEDDPGDLDSEYIPSPAARGRVRRRQRHQQRSAAVAARESLQNRSLLLRLLDVLISNS